MIEKYIVVNLTARLTTLRKKRYNIDSSELVADFISSLNNPE
jgi:hypothetical protein